ncbi:MAG: hypothetical protein JJU45_10380 [Acidimicrobiia bacterium]|nr:hypothetical protein [Acidimicrobiia bacterium]
MDFVATLRIVRRRWAIVATITLLGLFAALTSWILRGDDPSLYQATHTLAVPPGGSVNLAQAAAFLRTAEVPERVAANLDGQPVELAAQIRSRVRDDVGFLEVTALGVDPERTVVLANTFADELTGYMDEILSQQQRSELTRLEAEISDLEAILANIVATEPATDLDALVQVQQREQVVSQLAALESERDRTVNQLERTSTLVSVDPAEAIPISGPEFRQLFASEDGPAPADDEAAAALEPGIAIGLFPRIVLGLMGGLAMGLAAALVVDRLDPRLRLKADVESTFGWPVLAEIPPLTRAQQQEHVILAHDAPRSRTAEAYRVLRSALLFVAGQRASEEGGDGDSASVGAAPAEGSQPQGHVLLITSASPAEGKTTTVANLASVLGETGRRILVVNCDFRRPMLGGYMGVENAPPRVIDTQYDNVHLLAQVREGASEANPAEIVDLQRQVIDEARRRFDWVILDSAPLLTTNDANEILSSCDFVVVVARAGKTTRESADRCAESLDRRDASVLGVVLVAATEAPSARYYYYGDYYLDDDASGPPRREPPSSSDTSAEPDPSGPDPTSAAEASTSDTSAADTPAADAPVAETPEPDAATVEAPTTGAHDTGADANADEAPDSETRDADTGTPDPDAPDPESADADTVEAPTAGTPDTDADADADADTVPAGVVEGDGARIEGRPSGRR